MDRFKEYVESGDPSALDYCDLDFASMVPAITTDLKGQGAPNGPGGGGKATTQTPSSKSGANGRNRSGKAFTGPLPPPLFKQNKDGKPIACTSCDTPGWTKSRCPVCHSIPVAEWKAWDTRNPATRDHLKSLDPDSDEFPTCRAATSTYQFNQ